MKSWFRNGLVVLLLVLLVVLIGEKNSHKIAPRDRILILVSLDGFRWDYLQKFKAQTPCLNELATNGVHMERLIPVFPSLTFPNHYTIVTGLWPEHHGIVNNRMYDPNFKANFYIFDNPGPTNGIWWGGEPIWVTAIKQGRLADCMFWPGSEAEIEGVRPTEWRTFDAKVSPDAVVDTGLTWLAQTNERPNLVTLYFHEVDTESHHHGVESEQVAKAVPEMDEAVGRLMDGLHRLQLDDVANVIIVSDHGMTDLSTNRVIALSVMRLSVLNRANGSRAMRFMSGNIWVSALTRPDAPRGFVCDMQIFPGRRRCSHSLSVKSPAPCANSG